MIGRLPVDRRFWVALSLIGIAIATAIFLATGNPGMAGLVASVFAIVLSLCKLQQEKSEARSNSAAISSRDQM